MKYQKEVLVEVNGKQVTATVTVDMPHMDVADHVDAAMILGAVAANQNRVYVSRHHDDRVIRCLVQPEVKLSAREPLRLVA